MVTIKDSIKIEKGKQSHAKNLPSGKKVKLFLIDRPGFGTLDC